MTSKSNPAARLTELLGIMAALRTPGTGCPWDLQQTFKTIAPYTIEEAYEVADAIETGDRTCLKDELGDLLLQVVYHARMAEEEGAFEFGDVVQAINAKMVRRHPHVFGTEAEKAAGATPGFWERLKAEERAGRPKQAESVLDGVPAALPALTRAVKLQNKAARVGFDWPSLTPVMDKLKEELGELEHAIKDGAAAGDAIAEEFGDLLFVVANVARHLKLDPEAALRAANQKFIRRFQAVEQKLAGQGRTPAQSSLAEMDRLWDETKADEKTLAAKDR
jgi:MazG family protein